MSLDPTKLGTNVAELMEHLEQVYAEDDTAEVSEVITIVLVHTDIKPDTPEWEDQDLNEDGYGFVHYRATMSGWTHQLGLIEAARAAVRR